MSEGQLFCGEFFSVFVPTGWLSFFGIDSDGKESPKKLHIYKGARTELDIFSRAGITVCYYGENEIFISPKAFYDDVCDIAPFETEGCLWKGYTCKSFGYPYTMLEAQWETGAFQVMILMKNGEHSISLEDSDVRMIIESLKTIN